MVIRAYCVLMAPHKTLRNTAKSGAFGSKLVARKFNFTKRTIEALLPPPGEQRAYFYDTQVRGLALAVSPAGRKTFVWYRKVNGKPERVSIGLFPDMAIEQARGRASEQNAAQARGENPAEIRRTIRSEDTLGTLFARYFEDYAQHKKTATKMTGMFNLYFNQWRLRKLSTITHSDVVRHHAHISRTRGKYVGNRSVELLSSMFNFAIESCNWEKPNPAADVKPNPEEKRERFLLPEEMAAFFKALQQEPNETIRDYVALSLFVGQRRANVQAMRWDQINWHRAEWNLKGSETKNSKPLTVMLTPAAISILQRRQMQVGSEYVFPGRGRSGHLVEPKLGWKRILKRARIHNLRIHDLRRTFGAYQAGAGSSLLIIGKSLGHESTAATAVYARLDTSPIRNSVNRGVEAMLEAGGVAGLLEGGGQ
jgi:integrase